MTLLAKLKIAPSHYTELLSRDLILKRRTSRLHYNENTLKQNTFNQIDSEVRKYGLEFFCVMETGLINQILDLNTDTLFEDLKSRANREELNKLFRYSKEHAESKKDRL